MRIGIDIDDTITDTHDYVIYLKRKYLPEYDAYSLLPDDVFKEFIYKYDSIIHQNVSLKKDAKEAIKELKSRGHEIYIMSSRGSYSDNSYEDSYNYLIEHDIPFDKLICNIDTKVDSVKENKIDLFIDDNINICNLLIENGINVIKMKRHDDKEYEHLSFSTWEEIIKCIKENFNG